MTARAVGDPSRVERIVNRPTLPGANIRAGRARTAIWIAPKTQPCDARAATVIAHAAC